MIFGMTDRIEIWDMDRWNEEAMPASEDLSEDELYPEIIY
jgi:DNA-binding transcriptional regulator/RsmH inhibitor MraZ